MNLGRPGTLSAGKQGQVIVPVLALVLLLMIGLPWIVRSVISEAKASTANKYKQVALQAAESGMEKAAWSVTSNMGRWNIIMGGASLNRGRMDYTFADLAQYSYTDLGYRDMAKSLQYQILIGSYTATSVRVVSKGWSTNCPKPTIVRAVEAIFEQSPLEALTLINDFDVGTTSYPVVHWGAIRSYSSLGITSPGLPWPSFPRKFSTFGIAGWREESQGFNTDNEEYWAFLGDQGLPPVLDLEYYKQRARTSVPPTTLYSEPGPVFSSVDDPLATAFPAQPAGSAYFEVTNPNTDFYVRKSFRWSNPTGVLYVKGDFDGCNTTLGPEMDLNIEAAIFEGANHVVSFSTQGAGTYMETVPAASELAKDYAHAPGLFTPAQTIPIDQTALRGFLYVDGTLVIPPISGQSKIIGAVFAQRMKVLSSGDAFSIYRSSTIAQNVKMTQMAIRRTRYRELLGSDIP